MKTAISIPDPIFQAAETFAGRFGISRSELYAKAVAEYMASRKYVDVTEQLDKVYTGESSSLEDGVHSMQMKSIPQEEW